MPLWIGWTIAAGVGGWAFRQVGENSSEFTRAAVIAITVAVAAPFAVKALRK